MYRLVDEDSQDVLVEAEDVGGFFVEFEEGPAEVNFLGVHHAGTAGRRAEAAVLEVLNRQQEKIGEYFIGRVERRESRIELMGDGSSSSTYRFFGGLCEYPIAAGVWQRWASGVDLLQGEWFDRPTGDLESWLHVVQNSWFASRRRAARYLTGEVVYLDGLKMVAKPGFYCALGEAMNGPGGYFGSNLDALADCLSSEGGQELPLRIEWRSFDASNDALGHAFVNSILDIMQEFHIEVIAN
ncbi:barstar family protein [Streptacidiphilus albus]|uniref:barstar family protein n=1 Tax=Streptacidiphilus albus TaxID=105425 RepID=UPI0009DE7F2B|nr:barstar family protein [Streptacidiphilus albus]